MSPKTMPRAATQNVARRCFRASSPRRLSIRPSFSRRAPDDSDSGLTPRLGIEVVGVDRFSLQVLLEPVDDVPQAFDAVGGLARAGELVRLAGKPDHDGRLLLDLQGPEHRLPALRRRRAQVVIP